MLLYGPPGTGSTLKAHQIGKMLNGKDPKVWNKSCQGNESDLHVIIYDEIDAICKTRSSTKDGTGVHDSIVNQLRTKIDGVEALNNVLLIGMTNRKDLLDEALLRPGRLEVQVQISLPAENGRLQIIQIHTNKMKEGSFLAPDVNLQELGSEQTRDGFRRIRGAVWWLVIQLCSKRIYNPLRKSLEEATGFVIIFIIGRTGDKANVSEHVREVAKFNEFMLLDIKDEYSCPSLKPPMHFMIMNSMSKLMPTYI
ncbi:hypothetical protein ACET3Z_027590 [Daucus carota]